MARAWGRIVVGMVAGLVATARIAGAQESGGVAADVEPNFSHKHQFGIHVQGGVGYRGVFPYNEEYCGELQDDGSTKSSCLGRNPFQLDVGLSYGLTDRLELIAE